MMKKFLPLVLLLFMWNGASAQTDTARKKNSWLTYDDSDFSISFPRYFKIEFNGAPGTRVVLVSAQESELDSFKENINVISEVNHNPDARLDHYVTASELRLKELINGFTLIESTRTQIKGMECHKLIYTGRQGKYVIQWEQYLFFRNQRAFIVTLTSESGSFNNYQALFEKICNTINLKK